MEAIDVSVVPNALRLGRPVDSGHALAPRAAAPARDATHQTALGCRLSLALRHRFRSLLSNVAGVGFMLVGRSGTARLIGLAGPARIERLCSSPPCPRRHLPKISNSTGRP